MSFAGRLDPPSDGQTCESRSRVGRLVVVSGLSGAGKASVLRALEDLGYEAVDNAPLPMLEELVRTAAGQVGARTAVGVDARTRGFDSRAVVCSLDRLRSGAGLRPELIFVCADDAVLQQRFSETRRRHPLAEFGRVQDGIDAERRLTATLCENADLVIDTSQLPLSELRHLVARHFGSGRDTGTPGLAVSVISFAFPAGLPRESDMVLDVRFLRNPHYVAELRPLTGLDPAVAAYVTADEDFPKFLSRTQDLLDLLLPRFVREGKKYFTLAVGCTGGRHRSVCVAERLTEHMQFRRWQAAAVHRELMSFGQSERVERHDIELHATETQEASG